MSGGGTISGRHEGSVAGEEQLLLLRCRCRLRRLLRRLPPPSASTAAARPAVATTRAACVHAAWSSTISARGGVSIQNSQHKTYGLQASTVLKVYKRGVGIRETVGDQVHRDASIRRLVEQSQAVVRGWPLSWPLLAARSALQKTISGA